MSDTRRKVLLRFAATAIAAACCGRASHADDKPPPHPDPTPMPAYGPPPLPFPDPVPQMKAVYGPPPGQPVLNCETNPKGGCGSDGKVGADSDKKSKTPPKSGD